MPLALLNDLGGGEILVIGIAALLLFGRDLPVIARKFGRLVAEFKRGMSDASLDIRREMNAAADQVEETGRKAVVASDLRKQASEVDEAVRKSLAEPVQPEIKRDDDPVSSPSSVGRRQNAGL